MKFEIAGLTPQGGFVIVYKGTKKRVVGYPETDSMEKAKEILAKAEKEHK